jgi:parallel beta-helix repeat protein
MNVFTLFLIFSLLFFGSVNIILGNQILANECVEYDDTSKTIDIKCGSFNLTELKTELNSDVLSSNEKEFLLSANLHIGNFSKFFINSTDTDWLKIKGDSQDEYFGIRNYGTLIIDNVKISSWNPTTQDYILQNVNGTIKRPYIVSYIPNGPMNITNSEISFLGFNYKNEQGLSYYLSKNNIIDNNEIHNLWYGFYTVNSTNMEITNNHIYDNFKYGIDPHTGTSNLLIKNNTVHDTKIGIGIVCSLDCNNITIENNTIYKNYNAGIMLSRNMTDSIVRNNIIYDEHEAISISESYNNEVYGNDIRNSTTGIHVKLLRPQVYHGNLENSIYNNTISETYTAIKVEPNVSKNLIFRNIITDSRYGISISNITNTNNSIYDNELTDNLYSIRTTIESDSLQNEFLDLEPIRCKNEINHLDKKEPQWLVNTLEPVKSETESRVTTSIPSWVKNNVCWWSEGLISDKEFESGIDYLINKGIIGVKLG